MINHLRKGLMLLAALSLFACEKQNLDLNAEKPALNQLMDDWHKAASQGDFDGYFSAMDDPSIFVGTDAFEVWNKEEFMAFSEPHFEDGVAWDFRAIDRRFYHNQAAMNVVWFDEVLDTWMGLCRGSGVLIKEGEQWKIQHYVLSVTVPNDDIQAVISAMRDKKTQIMDYDSKYKGGGDF